MKIAVTGANGHVGGNLCRALLQQGHQVKALVHKDNSSIRDLNLERIKGDLADPSSLVELCKDAEVVFHLAALISVGGNRKALELTNVTGTRNLIDAMLKSKVSRLVHFSSIHALEHNPVDQPMDETRPLVTKALMMYESTKAKGDLLVQESIGRGIDAVILNPTAILGPFDYKPSLVGQVLLRLYKGTLPALVPGGYDWVDVRDVVQAAISAMTKGKTGERYILSGHWLSVGELARSLEEVTNKEIVKLTIPTSVARIGVPFIKIYSMISGQHPLYTFQSLDVLMNGNRMIINDKARRELDFFPRPIKETLADSIEWFRMNGYLN